MQEAVIAQSVMNELGEPVIYLAPTNQLVNQVVEKSQEYGISAERYVRGERFSPAFYNGNSVLVGAYETLFNGRSRFGVLGFADVVEVGPLCETVWRLGQGGFRSDYAASFSCSLSIA